MPATTTHRPLLQTIHKSLTQTKRTRLTMSSPLLHRWQRQSSRLMSWGLRWSQSWRSLLWSTHSFRLQMRERRTRKGRWCNSHSVRLSIKCCNRDPAASNKRFRYFLLLSIPLSCKTSLLTPWVKPLNSCTSGWRTIHQSRTRNLVTAPKIAT